MINLSSCLFLLNIRIYFAHKKMIHAAIRIFKTFHQLIKIFKKHLIYLRKHPCIFITRLIIHRFPEFSNQISLCFSAFSGYPAFSAALLLSHCVMEDERGFWDTECINQLNKGCHKGPDSAARGRGTGIPSPCPFVLHCSALKSFHKRLIAKSYTLSCTVYLFFFLPAKNRESMFGLQQHPHSNQLWYSGGIFETVTCNCAAFQKIAG